MRNRLDEAAEAIAQAEALLVGAGAGMGVDSGLPDFRGAEGFWREYPPLEELGINFAEMANPTWFERDPCLAWGFYGHRLHLYRDTSPHRGFAVLRTWADQMTGGAFVFTSNVDGHFQSAGFDDAQIVECHGSIHHLQCVEPCSDAIWSADDVDVDVDTDTFRARPPLPRCTKCNTLARPNILMFGDGRWLTGRTEAQRRRMNRWLDRAAGLDLVVVESGAGTAVPTVRRQCEQIAGALNAPLIRINPRESHGPAGTISLSTGALDALEALDERLFSA